MAGAGFKTFNTGDVLTASDVNTYLMQQTVMVFDDAAARTTALTGVVAEGMLSYLKDTNAVEVYDGSSWVASDDPNAIQNSIVDAKGDLISATADNTPARLAVGADNTVLTADSSTSTGLKWAAAAGGGDLTLITKNSFSNVASVTIDSIFSSTYDVYEVYIDIRAATLGDDQLLQMVYSGSVDTSGYYGGVGTSDQSGVGGNFGTLNQTSFKYSQAYGAAHLTFMRVGNSNQYPHWFGTGFDLNDTKAEYIAGYVNFQRTYTGIKLFSSSTNVTGTCWVYGLAKS